MNNESKKIFMAMSKVMSEIGAVGKNREAPVKAGGYAFRGIDDMYNAIQPALIKNGVFPIPRVLETKRVERKFSGGSTGIETFVTVEYTFYAEDGSFIQSTVTGEAMDSGDKSNKKALSAALSYCLQQIFCIPTSEPKDSENDHAEIIDNHSKQEPDSVSKGYFESLPEDELPSFDDLSNSKPISKTKDRTFNIGKFKGKKFSEINDSSYINWVKSEVEHNLAKCGPDLKEFYYFMKERGVIK